jgi:TPR repeat protein
MPSFEEKVEALRRLQEKRQQRQLDLKKEAAVEIPDASQEAVSNRTYKQGAGYGLDDRELPAVLEHYANLQDGSAAIHGDGPDGQAESDEADALYCLGHCFEKGIHECGQDLPKAIQYYRQAADKGSAVGKWRLGHLYEYGEGVEQSDELAARWYRLSADAGNAHAQSSLAILLEDGRASARYDDEALHWHREAAEQGNPLSQYCVACSLAGHCDTEEKKATMRSLLEESAAAGFPLAVEALAQARQGIASPLGAPLGGQSGSYNDDNTCDDYSDEDRSLLLQDEGSSLLDIVARVAKQIEHLPDTEAAGFLDVLLSTLDDPLAPDPAES